MTRAFLIIVDFDRFNPISVSGYRTYVDVHIKTDHTHLGLMDIQDLQKTEAITLTMTQIQLQEKNPRNKFLKKILEKSFRVSEV